MNNLNIILEALKGLKANDGFTLKGYAFKTYRTGWQVATDGVECDTPEEALEAVQMYNGICGAWKSPTTGKICIDHSFRVNTKQEAMRLGRECKQETVFRWASMKPIDVI